jgi:hypothetical protein
LPLLVYFYLFGTTKFALGGVHWTIRSFVLSYLTAILHNFFLIPMFARLLYLDLHLMHTIHSHYLRFVSDAIKTFAGDGLVPLRSHAVNQALTQGVSDFVQPNTLSRCPISTLRKRLLNSILCLVPKMWTNNLNKIIR